MAKVFSLEVDSRNMEGALRQLAQLTGAKLSNVIEFETLKMLETAVSRQKAARVKEIKEYYDKRRFGMYKPDYQPKRPFKGNLSKNGFKRYYLLNFYPDQLWNEIQNAKSKDFETAKKARGLLKKAWAQIGLDLGLSIKVPRYVGNAESKFGDYPQDTKAQRVTRGTDFHIEGTNARPYGGRDKERALASAMRGRTSFMRTNLKKGVFADAAHIARAYPGLILK